MDTNTWDIITSHIKNTTVLRAFGFCLLSCNLIYELKDCGSIISFKYGLKQNSYQYAFCYSVKYKYFCFTEDLENMINDVIAKDTKEFWTLDRHIEAMRKIGVCLNQFMELEAKNAEFITAQQKAIAAE